MPRFPTFEISYEMFFLCNHEEVGMIICSKQSPSILLLKNARCDENYGQLTRSILFELQRLSLETAFAYLIIIS